MYKRQVVKDDLDDPFLKIPGGTADSAFITSIVNAADGTPLLGGESIIRAFLSVVGTPNGLETIEIKPISSFSVFSRSTTPIPDTETTGAKFLRDMTPPVVTIITDISGNEVGGMKHVNDNTPTLSIKAVDAKSIGADDLTLICEVNGVTAVSYTHLTLPTILLV